jgi:hypothetical protein
MMLNVFMGFLAGTITSLGGALKDCPYEGFYPLKFFRSITVGTLGGITSIYFTGNPILAFTFAIGFERMIVECYKIIRAQRPGKFDLKHPHMLGYRFGFKKRKDLFA